MLASSQYPRFFVCCGFCLISRGKWQKSSSIRNTTHAWYPLATPRSMKRGLLQICWYALNHERYRYRLQKQWQLVTTWHPEDWKTFRKIFFRLRLALRLTLQFLINIFTLGFLAQRPSSGFQGSRVWSKGCLHCLPSMGHRTQRSVMMALIVVNALWCG